MISKAIIEEAMYEAMKKGATVMPPDVEAKLRKALDEETNPLAKQHLEISLENARLANAGCGLVCGDTGFPLYFIKAGAQTEIEGGFGALWEIARKATARCTKDAFLRPTMVDPLSRKNPGDNIGPGMPKVELSFEGDGDKLEIWAAPKGGGSEIFGTFYKMMYPSDGKTGIKKFIIECVKNACYAGKICPPAIVGIGIGGTADLCMKLAKEAALLRKVGEFNSDEEIAVLEKELLNASRELGLGPMGSSGINCVMGMHIETAVTHTAALPVAVNAQCLVGRRWKATVNGNNSYSLCGDI
jgi:tartrate/fumarate subfamily iron-sulfur-dependent hydro-lyase alpha chain